MSQQVWLVTVPVSAHSDAKDEFKKVHDGSGHGNGVFHNFRMPTTLKVGTLDSLMQLTDDLVKISVNVQNVVHKIERQYLEIAGANAKRLLINSKFTPEKYFDDFDWDEARYGTTGEDKTLASIVASIQGVASKADEELKKVAAIYSEKNLSLQALQRRKVINIMTSDFEDFLTPKIVSELEIHNTDILTTFMVVFPKQLEQEFLKTYENIGGNIACYGEAKSDRNGPSTGRDSEKGSPVVPGSACKVIEREDACLYSVVALKGHFTGGYYDASKNFIAGVFTDYIEPLKAAFREKRFVVRDWSYNVEKSGEIDGLIDKAEVALKSSHNVTCEWCMAHFGEVFSGWVHLKIIGAFAESILRYGLPMSIASIFILPDPKREKTLKNNLIKIIQKLHPELRVVALQEGEEEEEDDNNLPFVCQSFPLIGLSTGK